MFVSSAGTSLEPSAAAAPQTTRSTWRAATRAACWTNRTSEAWRRLQSVETGSWRTESSVTAARWRWNKHTVSDCIRVCSRLFTSRPLIPESDSSPRSLCLILSLPVCFSLQVSRWSAVWQAATSLFPSSRVNRRRYLNESQQVCSCSWKTASQQKDWLLLWMILILWNHRQCTGALKDNPGDPSSKSDLNYFLRCVHDLHLVGKYKFK